MSLSRGGGVAICITALSLLAGTGAARAATLPSFFEERTLASGLTVPVDVAWAPDGRMFIAEKAGRVRVVSANGTLQAAPLIDISGHVNNSWDHGLLGIAVDSAFATNHYLYLLYVYEPDAAHPNNPKVSRLTRVVVKSDNTVQNPQAPETVLLGSSTTAPCPAASNTLDCLPADSTTHSIGTVRSAPDGTLFVGNGDGADFNGVDQLAFRSYDEQSYSGKILHVDRDGHGLPSHQFCPVDNDLSHVCTKVYAKGFRNPFRFTLKPGGGLIVGDVGWNSWEEIDLPVTGGNYGWPCYEGNHQTPGYSQLAACATLYGSGPAAAAWPFNEYFHDQDTGSVLGGPLFTGDQYPDGYKGDIFFGDYALALIKRLELNPDGTLASVQPFATNVNGIVDLELSPAGNLAYVEFGDGWSATGTVREIEYSPGNLSPVAKATASPLTGPAPLQVALHGDASSDPDGDSLSYDWNFGDGSAHSSKVSPSHTYSTPGAYTARLIVDDGRGRTGSASVQITAGNTPPHASILEPESGATYRDGEPVHLSGAAMDDQEGMLTGSSLAWHVIAHHGSHIHDVGGFTGAEADFTPITDHDADTYYDVFLTATDSQGLTATAIHSVFPKTVQFSVQSVPSGASISYAGRSSTTPFNTESAVGFRTTVSADELLESGGRSYVFERWSDGGARLHNVTIPAQATTLVAFYRDLSQPAPVVAGGERDGSGPAITFSRPHGKSRIRRLRGTTSDPSGVRTLEIAIRSRRTVTFRWRNAHLAPIGTDRWSWWVRLAKPLPVGKYAISFRAVDSLGNRSFGLDGKGRRAGIRVRRQKP